MIEDDALELGESPVTFVAMTENEYVSPGVRPVTIQLVVEVVHVPEPGLAVTEKESTGPLAGSAGAVQVTVA